MVVQHEERFPAVVCALRRLDVGPKIFISGHLRYDVPDLLVIQTINRQVMRRPSDHLRLNRWVCVTRVVALRQLNRLSDDISKNNLRFPKEFVKELCESLDRLGKVLVSYYWVIVWGDMRFVCVTDITDGTDDVHDDISWDNIPGNLLLLAEPVGC